MEFFLLFVIISGAFCRNAIEFFTKHKKIESSVMEKLENCDNSSVTWIEYKYIFHTESDNFDNNLQIGVVLDVDNKLDCRLNDDNKTLEGFGVEIVNLLQETLNVRLLLIYKRNKQNFTKDIFILTFTGLLWFVFFVFLIILAICLRISTIQYFKMKGKTHEPWTWVEITLWAIAAACQQGLSNTPSGFASCCIFFLGYLMAYLLYTGLAAAITSILVQHDIEANFANVKLEKLHLISLENSRHYIKKYKNHFIKTEYVSNLEQLFEKLEKSYNIGIGPEIQIRQFMVNHLRGDEISSYISQRLNITFNQGFAIRKSNPWKKQINLQILEMDQAGLLQNRLNRHLQQLEEIDFNTGYSSAGQEHVGSATLLFWGGVLASFLFLIIEFVLYFYKKGRNQLGL